MPGRAIPLVTNEIYHVYNHGIDYRPTFNNIREYQRALETVKYYQFISPPLKFSSLLTLPREQREKVLKELFSKNEKLIEFLAFCFMPNHFHFLLHQLSDNGVSRFMSNFQNSYTRYFNIKKERKGPLFLDQFKAVRIETDEQLLHVTRYIHLNPYSSFVVKKIEQLESYSWSSFREYLNNTADNLCSTQKVLSFFKNIKIFREFVFDQASYQKELDKIKHLIIED